MTEETVIGRVLESAYEGVEDSRLFPDRASLERYRVALLERSAPQADFLLRHLPGRGPVLEVGCGNGRLLVELARRGEIDGALGIDIARSRIAFAREWAADEGYKGLDLVAGDALNYAFPREHFAAAILITGAFGYFEPAVAGSATLLARRLHQALLPGGLLCLELYPHPGYRRLLDAGGGRARTWTELPEDDPWRFYLSDLSIDESGRVLTHEKTFIHRTSSRVDTGRRERLYLYDEEHIRAVLVKAGFGDIHAFEGWTDRAYGGGEIMVVTATK